MILPALLPIAVWRYGPVWLHPVIIVLLALVALGAVMSFLRYLREYRAEIAAITSKAEYRWPEGWSVTAFHRALLTYLKLHDWKVLAANAVDPDRLLLRLQRDRLHIALLVLRPGVPAAERDVDLARAVQRDENIWEAAIVSDPPLRRPTEPDDAGRMLRALDYEALTALSDALDGGPEEQRRRFVAEATKVAQLGQRARVVVAK